MEDQTTSAAAGILPEDADARAEDAYSHSGVPLARGATGYTGKSGLGLRARATVAFGLIAFILSGVLAMLSYGLTRNYLLDERQATAVRQAYVNARFARERLRAPEPNVLTLLSSLPSSSQSRVLIRYQGEYISGGLAITANEVPPDLLRASLAGRAGRQRFALDGVPYLAVGVPIPEVQATYFEFTNLEGLEGTLSTLAKALALCAVVTALGGAAVGRYASSRVVRPLRGIAGAASGIARGRLDTRLDAKGDRDLEPLVDSFNDMVDTLEERIHREARFASDVSHELRTPIAAMHSAANVVRRRLANPDQAVAALDILEAKIDGFNRLVTDLLEMSRLEAGVAKLEREPVDVERFARSVLAGTGRGNVPLGVQPGSPRRADFDSRRVGQMLANLLENADKYAGGATALVVSGLNGWVRFAVEDRGPGIPEHERHHIFERFVRGESSSRPGAKDGTGLGLSLVAEHARLHGGRVWVEDRAGGGSRFVVELPEHETPGT
jgi:two-component system, OmpR family, sensor histidine kinase MtrB